nr:ankyrin repeat domain-containing protein 62-like isoform X2 [Taeniopygia guttata]
MVLADLHSAAATADLAQLRQHWWLNKHRINGYNRDKQTPLHLACINGHADVVQFLVEKKCKLNPCDRLDKSPLIKAVEHQHRDCAAILLEHGANHDHRAVNGNTALHFAVMASSKSLVKLLLEHGADIDAKNKWGYTPLTLAIIENHEEMVKFLLQKGADVNALDKVYRTPLAVATLSGNNKVIQLLLQHGAVYLEPDKELYPCQPFTKIVQDDLIANEQIGSSCYETTPVIPLETAALEESCDVPKVEAAEKKNDGPAADQNKVSRCSNRVQPYRGDYKAEGAEKKEDKYSLCNPETDPKSRGKVRARVRHLAAKSTRLDARSAAVEHGKGVLPAAASVEAEKEDCDSSWDSEPFSAIVEEVFAGGRRPAADRKGVGVRSLAAERSKGVLQPAEKSGEDDNSSWDTETDSEGRRKVLADVQLPAADQNRVGVSSAAVEHGKAEGAEQRKHYISTFENKLKDLKKPLNKKEYYADSGKNAQKEKVITILRNMQGILVDSFDSSAAAIPQLEERIQRLQMQMAKLETTIQQQAKTIEVFETIQQPLTSDSSVDTGLCHHDFPHTIKNCFGEKLAKRANP